MLSGSNGVAVVFYLHVAFSDKLPAHLWPRRGTYTHFEFTKQARMPCAPQPGMLIGFSERKFEESNVAWEALTVCVKDVSWFEDDNSIRVDLKDEKQPVPKTREELLDLLLWFHWQGFTLTGGLPPGEEMPTKPFSSD